MISAIILLSLLSFSYSADVDITAGPPPYDKPWVPGWGHFSDPNSWKQRHENMLKQTHEHKDMIKVVFLGDSKTEGWAGSGKEVWNEYYAKRGAFNYGIGGDSTRQILWRINNGELDGLTPKVLVLMIGGNNLHNDYNRGINQIKTAFEIVFEKLIILLKELTKR
jgi:beta-glucosidase